MKVNLLTSSERLLLGYRTTRRHALEDRTPLEDRTLNGVFIFHLQLS